jgi:hypothetical protein
MSIFVLTGGLILAYAVLLAVDLRSKNGIGQ